MRIGWATTAGLAMAAALALAPSTYAGQDAPPAWERCGQCHTDLAAAFAKTPHAASPAGCEGCHGPADEHVAGGGDPSKIRRLSTLKGRDRAEVCLSCHQKGEVAHWVGSTHDARNLDCGTCHDPHPKGAARPHLLKAGEQQACGGCHAAQAAKMYRSAHMPVREGAMSCTSCHNPHGTLDEKSLRQRSVNENCYTCHAEKRGPMLWEHPPVRENCTTCHDPHGSTTTSLLKVKVPVLCQNCHVSSRHPSQTHMPAERFAFNHGCLNCHQAIHGSNHPSGNRLLR